MVSVFAVPAIEALARWQTDSGIRELELLVEGELRPLGEGEPLGHHHEIENVAVLARGEVEPHRLLVIDEKRRRLFLVEGRESPPLPARLLEPHAPAHDLRNQKALAQLVEELGRKAHAAGPADSLGLSV